MRASVDALETLLPPFRHSRRNFANSAGHAKDTEGIRAFRWVNLARG
jgi:hypothetical protein